ncbi:MAG: GHMP kinase [Ktedonobacteraceae bacterium]|nr:GHMP kinase [Ktedonobacteraceae bacterium]
MWQYKNPLQNNNSADIEHFLEKLNSQKEDFFSEDEPLFVARAPGRLDLMGGIADYSGSLVLEMPLAVATIAAVQLVSEPTITVYSTAASEIEEESIVSLPLASFSIQDRALSYKEAHELLATNPRQIWAAYVLGAIIALQHEYGLRPERGLRILVDCQVPIGKGVSSSAALEVAAMHAICAAYGLDINGRKLAILSQTVENLIVGAPCGVMDQMTAACGEDNSLLALLCQPAELQDPVPLPEDIEIWGIDSGVRHAVTGADYGSVRIGAFMGYRIIAQQQGFPVTHREQDYLTLEDPQWQGYLANIPPSLWEMKYRASLPLSLLGSDFLEQYQGSTDTVTHIDPQRTYSVQQPTAHPIYENHRVHLFRTLLAQPNEDQMVLLGELMYQSHASYSACGLGSKGTDILVDLVRKAGPSSQLYGAKITGGGSGGTVAVLARKGAQGQIQHIVEQYEQQTGLKTTILRGSSSGAKAWGILQFFKA